MSSFQRVCVYVHVFMRDEKERRKKQARSDKQTRKSNTAHPRQSLFLRKHVQASVDMALEGVSLL